MVNKKNKYRKQENTTTTLKTQFPLDFAQFACEKKQKQNNNSNSKEKLSHGQRCVNLAYIIIEPLHKFVFFLF